MGAGIGNKDSENQGGSGRDIKSRRLSAAIHRMYRHLNRIRKGGVRVRQRREGPFLLRFHHVREGSRGLSTSRPQRRCKICLGRLRFIERSRLILLLGIDSSTKLGCESERVWVREANDIVGRGMGLRELRGRRGWR